jgi:hypothetical protein
MPLDQLPHAGQVVGDLRQVFIGRSVTRPVLCGDAATNRLPDHLQPFHRIRPQRAVRLGGLDRPQCGRGLDELGPASHHRRRVIGGCVEERLAGQRVAVGQQLPDRAPVSRRHRCSPPTPGGQPAPAGHAARSRLRGVVATRRSRCCAERRRPAGFIPDRHGSVERNCVRQEVPLLVRC